MTRSRSRSVMSSRLPIGMTLRDLERVIYYTNYVVIEIAQRHVEQVANRRRQRLEEPDVRHRPRELDVTHALAPYLGKRRLNAAAVADHAELAVRVAHIWFFKTLPSPMGNLLDMTLRDLERVIYYTNYVVIDTGEQEVQERELLDEDRYLELRAKAKSEGDSAFKADIGSPAVRALLERINVDKLADELREAVATETSQHRKKQMLKRLEIVDAFRNSGSSGGQRNDPRWVILDVIPGIPPDLRPR